MGGTPIPPERQKKPKGSIFEPYLPTHYRLKFLRYQVAEFKEAEAERLKELTYDELIERKCMKRAHSQAISDEEKYQRWLNT